MMTDDSVTGSGLPLPRRLWWPWDEPATRVAFSRAFSVAAAGQAVLYITASGSAQVWCDELPLPLPPSHLPMWRSVRRVPVSLHAGPHTLAIEVATEGQQQPFLLASLDGTGQQGGWRIPTDGSWIMVRDPGPGWHRTAPDGRWASAWAFDGVWAEPWGMPCDAPTDWCRLTTGRQRVQRGALDRIVRSFAGLHSAGACLSVGPDGGMLMCPAHPLPGAPPILASARPGLEWYRTREVHSRTNNAWLDLFRARTPHVVFDAGAETFARLKLSLISGGPAMLAVTTGESLNEIERYDRRVTDILQLDNGESFATSPTGFRYVKVTALSGRSREVEIGPIEVQHIRYPTQARGGFRCSDDLLNEIWDASVRTAHLCMQTELWDGIKRDQLPWMGDLYVEALVAYHAFGDYALARRTYAVLGELGPAPPRPLDQQTYPGLHAVWRVPSGEINDIPSYTLWWLVGLADFVRYSGDVSLLQELAAEIEAVVRHLADNVDAQGIYRARGGWDLVDWSPLPPEARFWFTHLLACQALAKGCALVARMEGQGAADRSWSMSTRRLLARMRRAALDGWAADRVGLAPSHHTHAMGIRSGVLDSAAAAALFARYLDGDPPARMTYWHRYGDLEAALAVRRVGWGLNYLRRHWGPLVRSGLTTLWETFDPAWLEASDPHAVAIVGADTARYGGYETSLCHGWSAGPVPWLHRAVLGVRPTVDGFAGIRFEPALGDLTWAEGVVPTPHGDIDVRLRREGSDLWATIRAPASVAVQLGEATQQSWHVNVQQYGCP